jgi:hypothetical protein
VSVLHVLRDAADPRALPVIRAQAAQGTPIRLLLLGGGSAPEVGGEVYAVADAPAEGAKAVSWEEALEMIFGADTVVTW